jgi:thymidylate kinase
LAGETPKSRYLERWRDMIEEQADGMKHALTEAVGEEHAKALVSGQELDAVTLRKAYVRTAVRLRSFEMAKILAAKLRNGTAAYLRPAGRVWAFSGPDGSGKTTLIDALAAFATRRVMVSTARFHTRPFLLPRLNAFVPMSSEKRRVLETERDVPERSNAAKSFIRLLYALVDYNLGYWFKVRPQLAKGNLVVFDRYYQDFLVDSHRRGIALPQWILDTCARFVPKPDRHVFVLAKGEALAARKGELDALEGDGQSVRYRHLATTVGSPVVIDTDNADPKDLAATLALTLIADLRTDRAKANTNPEQPS